MSIAINMTTERGILAHVLAGQSAEVVTVDVPGHLGERLMELGITPGVTVKVVRRGAFGDPLQLFVRGYMLSLRKAEARLIAVRPA